VEGGGRGEGGGEREVLSVFQGSVCYADNALSCAWTTLGGATYLIVEVSDCRVTFLDLYAAEPRI